MASPFVPGASPTMDMPTAASSDTASAPAVSPTMDMSMDSMMSGCKISVGSRDILNNLLYWLTSARCYGIGILLMPVSSIRIESLDANSMSYYHHFEAYLPVDSMINRICTSSLSNLD